MIITLLLIAYLVFGFIQSSLLHKNWWPMDSGLTFIMLSIGWPIVILVFGISLVGQCLEGYMEWLRKD